jgi:hypothetical protein
MTKKMVTIHHIPRTEYETNVFKSNIQLLHLHTNNNELYLEKRNINTTKPN